MYPHYFIPFKTQENFYIYDLINRNIEVCDELTYTLYLDLYRNDHKYIHKKAIFNNEKYENYSVEQLNKAISNINAHLNYIKKHSQKHFYYTNNISRNDILKSLSETKQVILEVTRKCNLQCTYCCYGALYKKIKPNKQSCSSYTLLSYLRCILELKKNFNVGQKELFISFYGGEALLNMEAIKEVVEEISKSQFMPTYTITTNGILLDKYIDFLVKYDFKVFVSLDGGFKENSYRIFPNGKESFTQISSNIEYVRNKYPTFYKNNMSFLTVLHDRNNVLSINDFFPA